MEKLLQILKHPSILTVCVAKAFLLLFVCTSLANNGYPAKTKSLNTGPSRHKINTAAKRIIKTNVKPLPVPSISYSGGPFTFTVADVISPMAAISTNVSAFGYNSVGINVGSRLSEATSVAVDAAGNVYANSFDFRSVANRIYRISGEDSSTTELPWNNIYNPFLSVDRQGNLYVGTGGTGEILKYTGGGGTPEHIADVPCDISAMVIDHHGNIYVRCFYGKVYKIAAGGNTPELFLDGSNRGHGLAVDAEGNVYVSAYTTGKIYKTPAGGGPEVEVGTGFNGPTGLIIDATGNLYVNDRGNEALKMIPAENQQATITLATNLSYSYGLAMDQSGSLYVARANHSSIVKFNPTGGYFADKLLPGGLTLNNQTGTISGTPTRLTFPTDYKITAWNSGGSASTTINITTPLPVPDVSYGGPFAFTAGEIISPLVPATTYVSPFGYNSTKQLIGSGLNYPAAVAVDMADNVYTSSWDPAANIFRLYKYNAQNGSRTELPWNRPNTPWLTTDRHGNLYAAESNTGRLMKYPGGSGSPEHISTGAISNIGAIAVDIYDNIYIASLFNGVYKKALGEDVPVRISAAYSQVYGLAVDAESNVYISTRVGNKVYKIPADGSTTIEVVGGFKSPMGLALDATGNLFVNDSGNFSVKMVPADNQQAIVTIATGLANAYALALDRTGSLYAADAGDSSIFKYNPTGGYFADKLLPGGLKLDNQTGTISGTPTRGHPAADYIITAHNKLGTLNTVTVNLSVSTVIPSISYGDKANIYKINKEISPLTATSAHVSSFGYSSMSGTYFSSGLRTPTSIAIDTAGNIYTNSTEEGTFAMKLYKISGKDGSKTELSWPGMSEPKLVTDRNGNLYATDFITNAVLKYPGGSGNPERIPLGFPAQIGSIAVDDHGNIFVGSVKRYNSSTQHGVYKLPAGGGAPVLISGDYENPYGLLVDAENNIYVSDSYANKVFKIPADGSDAVEMGGGFSTPVGLAIDASHNLYVIDRGNKMLKMVPAGSPQTTVALITGLNTIEQLALGKKGNIYIAEREIASILHYVPNGGYFSDKLLPAGLTLNNETGTISGTPTRLSPRADYKITAWNKHGEFNSTDITVEVATLFPTISYSGGPYLFRVNDTISPLIAVSAYASPFGYGSPVAFGNPATVTGGFEKDRLGNKYVLDLGQKKIFKYAADSAVAVEVVTGANPTAIAVDDAGNLYVADQAAKTIIKVAAGTGTITTIAGGLGLVRSISVATDGTLFVADNGRGEIKRIPAGGGTPVMVDGGFSNPSDVDVDAEGNIYVADQYNKAIKKVWLSKDSHVETLYSGNSISCLALDNSRNIFAIDIQTGRMFMIPADGSEHKTIASGGDYYNVNSLSVDDEGVIYFTSFFNTSRQIMPTGGYFIDGELPAGLQLKNTTGEISGTPTRPTPAANYKITAWNDYGETGSTTINTRTVSADAGLSALAVNKGTLSPAFDKDSLNYQVMVPAEDIAIKITPTAVNTAAAIAVNADTVSSGISTNVNLQPGVNIINITVKLDDAEMAYKLLVKRIPSDNAYLSGLTLDQGIPKSKVRGTNYRDYTAITEVSAVRVTASVQDSDATIKINGATVTPGTPSAEIPLSIGSNTINTVVTAPNGLTTNTYQIVITRKLSDNALLSALIFDPAISKRKVTGPNYRDYVATVANDKSTISVTATPHHPLATVKINGVATHSVPAIVPLNPGPNTITTAVTAADGVTTLVYSLIITRRPSTDATLAGLTINPGIAKNKVTGNNYRDYKAKVGADVNTVTITPTAANAEATIKVNGLGVTSGMASAPILLNVGNTIIKTIITAGDGVTIKTYSVVVNRSTSGNASLQSVTLSPSFAVSWPSPTNFTATVNTTTESIRVRPVTEQADAEVTIKGMQTIGSYSPEINLEYGENVIPIVVTAQNNTKQAYTLTITRPGAAIRSNNVKLSSEELSASLPEVTISKALSPNGDGINDVLTITGIEAYADNTLQIINNKGTQVAAITGYNNQTNAFDGRNRSGMLQLPGTYFYLLQYKDGKETRLKSGYFILKY
ncbi:hypothetical protein DJ568_07420 [Mucilaginibacter hurinus]|uniref:Cadherin-like beta-sandwich-like domain-containing protein n=1 Tax=Mucilaginibacter hurinus TaxID=2201324 RepID=A0A367GS96_9SPHI|nr:cadherin-like beta sandwich domain-containing protein [Mucilaginibacter hurinus]RCH55706.1 hypothetical protein DJ568_07420 [Mucilaginibacter hurinus]